VEDSALDLGLVAFNVRCLRMARNMTQAELASKARIDVSTLHRLETGRKVHRNTIQKIAVALGESISFLNSVLPYGLPTSKRELFVHRHEDLNWYSSGDRRKRIPADHQDRIQREEERLRLGRLGLVQSFQAYMIAMPRSPGMSQVEVFDRVFVGPNPTYDTFVIACIRGKVIFRMGDQQVSLSESDSIGFSADEEATIEPASPIGLSDLPPLVWAISANRRGHVPIEFQDRKRVRTRHPRRQDGLDLVDG
jgi:transcriptional regulator with XRE-family HTH domain